MYRPVPNLFRVSLCLSIADRSIRKTEKGTKLISARMRTEPQKVQRNKVKFEQIEHFTFQRKI